MFVFTPTSDCPTMTWLPPVMNKSLSFASVPFDRGSGGRSVTMPYDRAWTMAATDVVFTLQFVWPKMRAKVRPNDGCRTATCIPSFLSSQKSTQLGEGHRRATTYGLPGRAHPAADWHAGVMASVAGLPVDFSSCTRIS